MIRVSISTLFRVVGTVALCSSLGAPVMAANQSLLVFPVDKPETVDQSVADTVLSSLRARVGSGARYDAMTFYAKSPLVSRAVSAGAISEAQMAGPFAPDSASSIARAIGADVALIASIEDASVDTAAGKSSVTISAQLVSAVDGKVLKTAGASGEAVKASTPDLALLRLAADAAAGKAAAQLFGDAGKATAVVVAPAPGKTPGTSAAAAVAVPSVGKKSKSKKSGLLIGGLILAGVIIASSHHGGSGGGGNSGPPPFPF